MTCEYLRLGVIDTKENLFHLKKDLPIGSDIIKCSAGKLNALCQKHMAYTSIDFIISAAEIRDIANDIFRNALVTDQIPED